MGNHSEEAVKLLAQRILDMGFDDIPARERHVIERVAKRVAVSRNINLEHDQGLSFGDRLADHVASFGGSWTFLIAFAVVLAAWVSLNTYILAGRAFDPYPYILLNLFLSMLAAVQAPIIMMSQNRLAAKDRLQAAHDYEVNLKAEIEILALHEKLDELRNKDMAELIKRVKA
jgi:uncharacterized membrane protein